MSDTATTAPTTARIATGRVLGKTRQGAWRICVGENRHNATRAAGCLLEPVKGDLVLTACTENETVFIIQILERNDDAAATIQLPRTSALLAGKGKGRLRIEAAEVSMSGGLFRSTFKRVVSLAEAVEARAELLRERYARRFEEVEGVKDSKIGRLRCLASGLLSFRGKTIDVKADERTKIDGGTVDIG